MHPSNIIHVCVYEGLADWECGLALAHLHTPMPYFRADRRFTVRTVGSTRASVVSMGGFKLTPELTLDEVRPADSAMLILPGGTGWDLGQHDDVLDLAKRFLAAGVPVAAICGATGGLARAGVLDTAAHTSEALEYLQAIGYRGASLYQEAPAITAGNLITAKSSAAIAFARHLFAHLHVADAAILDAWEGLFTTGRPEFYFALMQAAGR